MRETVVGVTRRERWLKVPGLALLVALLSACGPSIGGENEVTLEIDTAVLTELVSEDATMVELCVADDCKTLNGITENMSFVLEITEPGSYPLVISIRDKEGVDHLKVQNEITLETYKPRGYSGASSWVRADARLEGSIADPEILTD
jgi:hypothetical protein